ncbi:MAG TPA: GNAT family N-acetyltransferase [Rudaea sp.]
MQAVVATTIEAFGRDEWNALFPDELEDWSYYRAVEKSGIAGFAWVYFGVRDEDGRLCAAVPGFLTDYRLDTTMTGAMRRLANGVTRVFPRLLRQRMLSLGSPVSEVCHLGFALGSKDAQQRRWLDAILARAEEHAREQRAQMIAIKDAGAEQDALWSSASGEIGLRRQPGLPTAALDVRFDSIDAYLESLSAGTRKDMRRKLKAGQALRVEWRDNIDDIRERVMELYRQTHAHAQLDFEELTADYFAGVLREMPGRSSCATYWAGERLVAFNLVLFDGARLIDKYLGMDYAHVREYNLYFYTWFENVRRCIEHEIPVYQSGQGLHAEKVRLGSRLELNSLWYRHRNPFVDRVFAVFESLARLDRDDPQLKPELGAPPRRPSWAAWTLLIAIELFCQIALKSAGVAMGELPFSWSALHGALGNVWLWIAIATYIGQFLVWMTILRDSSLSGAFPTSAITIVGVVIAGALLFGEPIGWLRVVGAAIIIGGILLLGDDAQPSEPGAGIDINKITLDSTLKDLEIQSLDAVQIIFEIEDHYKITLPDRDPNFDTESVKGLVDAVERLLAEKQAAGTPPAQG